MVVVGKSWSNNYTGKRDNNWYSSIVHFKHFLLSKCTVTTFCYTVHGVNSCHLINSHREGDFWIVKGIMSYMGKATPQ